MLQNMVTHTPDPKELFESIGVTSYPARWESLIESECEQMNREGCPVVEKKFLRDLNEEYHLFEHRFEELLLAAAQIRDNPALMLYVRLLCVTARTRQSIDEDAPSLVFPQVPEGASPLGYDMAPLFALLPTVPASYREFRSHGVDDDIIRATLRSYETCVGGTEARTGRPGFARYFNWAKHYVASEILRIGRLEFEMVKAFTSPVKVFRNADGRVQMLMDGMKLNRCGRAFGLEGFDDQDGFFQADLREDADCWEGYPVVKGARAAQETVTLRKDEWQVALQKGDPVISVHIPSGPGLTREACDRSFAEVEDLMRRSYPDFPFRAFVCYSWLMDPQLSELLKTDSNIVAFQNRFTRFPTPGGTTGIFSFIFLKPVERLEDLPENTSLERALKAHYLSGKKIYDTGGLFL